MRSVTFFIAAALFTFSAHAALVKRTDDPQVQVCMNDLTSASEQLAIIKTDVDAFTRSKLYAGALAIHEKEQVLEARLTTAGNSCCAVSQVVTSADADAFLGVVEDMVPLIQGALASIVTKKPEFDAIFLATTLVKADIKNLNIKSNNLLDTCLFRVTPTDYIPIANQYVGNIKTAFASARTAYGITL